MHEPPYYSIMCHNKFCRMTLLSAIYIFFYYLPARSSNVRSFVEYRCHVWEMLSNVEFVPKFLLLGPASASLRRSWIPFLASCSIEFCAITGIVTFLAKKLTKAIPRIREVFANLFLMPDCRTKNSLFHHRTSAKNLFAPLCYTHRGEVRLCS